MEKKKNEILLIGHEDGSKEIDYYYCGIDNDRIEGFKRKDIERYDKEDKSFILIPKSGEQRLDLRNLLDPPNIEITPIKYHFRSIDYTIIPQIGKTVKEDVKDYIGRTFKKGEKILNLEGENNTSDTFSLPAQVTIQNGEIHGAVRCSKLLFGLQLIVLGKQEYLSEYFSMDEIRQIIDFIKVKKTYHLAPKQLGNRSVMILKNIHDSKDIIGLIKEKAQQK